MLENAIERNVFYDGYYQRSENPRNRNPRIPIYIYIYIYEHRVVVLAFVRAEKRHENVNTYGYREKEP